MSDRITIINETDKPLEARIWNEFGLVKQTAVGYAAEMLVLQKCGSPELVLREENMVISIWPIQ